MSSKLDIRTFADRLQNNPFDDWKEAVTWALFNDTSSHESDEVVEALAGLAESSDRKTCHFEPSYILFGRCTNCGENYPDAIRDKWKFCPSCGTRLEETDDLQREENKNS